MKITKEDREKAIEALEKAPVLEFEEVVKKYKEELDAFMKEYGAKSYYELLCRAELSNEFSPDITCKILAYYSFLSRHRV
mgnify:CR=1 FL=1